MANMLRNLPSRLHCLRLRSIPTLVFPDPRTLESELCGAQAFLETHGCGAEELNACLALPSFAVLEKLELELSLSTLGHYRRKEFELSQEPYDIETYFQSLLGRSGFRHLDAYLLRVVEDRIEESIRDALESVCAPGRDVVIVITKR